MWVNQIILALIGISSGIVVAGGLFSFIIELGIVADFADRTHTAEKILLYEDCVALGGIIGNFLSIFQIHIPYGGWLLPVFGMLSGIFVGCWAMALAEILNVFPIFVRRLKIVRYISVFILSIAIGKGLGSLLFFYQRW
jgi:stage V sporulation protein AB